MSFLDEVNSLKQKAGISKPNLALVVGIGVLALAVLVFGAFQLWTAFSVPDAAFIQEETVQGESQDQVEQQSSETRSETNKSTIYVHITGEVVSPGMYQLPGGSRVSQAIDAAGGLTEAADDRSINLARELSDGEQIIVTSKQMQTDLENQGSNSTTSNDQSFSSSTQKVNINTATKEELMTLDGVGEATAEKIIAYRQEHGSFSSIEEIKEVSGIGDKKYEAIKESITV